MSWISTADLVAATSQSGGVGLLATGPLNEEETRASIQRIRALTDKPFGCVLCVCHLKLRPSKLNYSSEF